MVDDATADLGALRLAGLDGSLDDLAIGLSSQRNGGTAAAGTSCTTDTMDVDLGGLGSLVVDDGVDTLDIKTTRGEIGGKEEVDLSISKVLDTLNTL